MLLLLLLLLLLFYHYYYYYLYYYYYCYSQLLLYLLTIIANKYCHCNQQSAIFLIRIKNPIKNLLSLNCQYVPSFTRPYFARLKKNTRFLFEVFILYAVIFAILLHIIKAINNCFDTILRPFACIIKP